MSGPRYVFIGVACLVFYVIGGWLLRDHSLALALFGNAALLAPPILTCALIVRRRKAWTGCHKVFWSTFGIGVGLWTIGHVGWAYDYIVHGRVSWLAWHTVFSLCGGIGPLVALLARPHRGARPEAAATVGLVVASYGLLCVFIYAYFVLVPNMALTREAANQALLGLVQVNRALLFLATVSGLVFAWRSPWRATYASLVLATGMGLALRFATNIAILRGTYHAGTLYDLAWITPFLLYAQAVAVSPASADDAARADASAGPLHAAISALPVFLIPALGYGWLLLYPIGYGGDAFRSLLTGLMTVAGLGLLTLRLASQGGELQRADARLRLLAAATEQTADLILITRADGAFEHANDAFVRAVGYTRQELARLSSPDLMDRGVDVGRQLSDHVRDRGIWRGVVLRRCRDGNTFPASCTVVGLKDDAGRLTHYVGVERDITDELKLRDQLVHSERLSAIGELVAGVAHEINNPLQTIIGSVELMMEERNTAPSRHDLQVVRREATRAGQIVRNLLSFVRRSAPDRSAADLNDIVRSTVELRAFHLQQRNVRLTVALHHAPLPVLANREEIQQVVLNLLMNAEHAVLAASDAGSVIVRTRVSGSHHVVEVADDGPGVSPELRGRIFEPFFTTKDVGEGTGLGLSISHGIASAHGGALELADAPSGACFRLSLPARVATGAPEGAPYDPADVGRGFSPAITGAPNRLRQGYGESAEAPAKAEGAPYAITENAPLALIIDDEAPIRALLGKLLQRRGFEVITADTGEAALEGNHRERLHLVLCDVRMPGLSGFEIYERLTAQHPPMASRFVFITGDGGSVAADRPSLADVPVLAKPFSAADLDALLARLGHATVRVPSSSL